MKLNPNPNCREQCKFSMSNSYVAADYFPNSYDVYVNSSISMYSGDVKCSTCNMEWRYYSTHSATEYRELSKCP